MHLLLQSIDIAFELHRDSKNLYKMKLVYNLLSNNKQDHIYY